VLFDVDWQGGQQLRASPLADALVTIFLLPPANPAHTCAARIFMPGGELPFAGHPTVGGAIAFGRVLADMLFDVQPGDPLTFVAVIVTLSAAALVAVVVPARRAVRVDPVTALRSD